MKVTVGKSLASLSLRERLVLYRQSATAAMQRAEAAKDEDMRAGFIVMAAGWQQMADELERTIAQELRDRPGLAPDVLLPEKRN